MLKIITRGFYGCMISGLCSLQVQGAEALTESHRPSSATIVAPTAPTDLMARFEAARTSLDKADQHPGILLALNKIAADIAKPDSGGVTASALDGYLAVLHEAQAWIAAQEATSWSAYPFSTTTQPLPTIEEQLLGYDVPAGQTLTDVLMGKIVQGIYFASPEVTDPLNRYRLYRLYQQMKALHGASGITMNNLYEFGLILASLFPDNGDLRGEKELQDRYSMPPNNMPVWFNGYDWLADSIKAQISRIPGAYIYPSTDTAARHFGIQDPVIIFEPNGHHGFHESNKTYLRPDRAHRRYLIGLGFKGSVHGGSINGAVTRYLHDITHGSDSEYGSEYQWKRSVLFEYVLTPIFQNRDSLSLEEQRVIDFALYSTISWLEMAAANCSAGITQKELGRLAMENLMQRKKLMEPFDLGLNDIQREIHPALGDYGDTLTFQEEEGVETIRGEITHNIQPPESHGTILGICLYDLVLPRSLTGPCVLTVKAITPSEGLSDANRVLYDSISAELFAIDMAAKTIAISPKEFRHRFGDEVKSLHWVSTGNWINPPAWKGHAYTLDTVFWWKKAMQKVYGALLDKGLELWTDEPVPADVLASLRP